MTAHPRELNGARAAPSAPVGELPLLALDWLREVLRAEFTAGPELRRSRTVARARRRKSDRLARFDLDAEALYSRDPFGVAALYAQGDVENALWYREWHRHWRRFRWPDQLQRFQQRLDRAERPEEVYRALTECAVQVVGGYTCLLFPPEPQTPLRAVPNPALGVDAGRLTISIPLPEPGIIAREDVLGTAGGALSALAPLFSEEQAVSLAHAPFGDGGVIIVVERRQERVFAGEEWEALRMLSAHAAAALARVRMAQQVDVLRHTEPATRLLGEAMTEPVVEHALGAAAQGMPLTLCLVRLEGLEQIAAEDGELAAARVGRTAAEVLRELTGALGVVIHRADEEYLLVLPRLNEAQAEALAARLARQLPARVQVRVGTASCAPGAEQDPEVASAAALVAAAEEALARGAAPTPPLVGA